MIKTCSKCGLAKPLSDFYVAQNRKDGLASRCKLCALACANAWRDANPDRVKANHESWYAKHPKRRVDGHRKSHLQRTFGITLEEYAAMFGAQTGVCAICGLPPKEGHHLAVDHDHVTGRVRWLLCYNCNVGLGNFKDNPVLLQKAAAMLEAA